MANNVDSFIELRSANEEATKYFRNFTNLMNEDQWSAYDLLYGSHEKTHSWMVETIGTKWLIVEDADENCITLQTAWDSPLIMFNDLHDALLELDKEVQLTITYQDEVPNFVGWKAFDGDREDDELFSEDEYSEFIEGWRSYEELSEEDEDTADELYDVQMENFWEDWHSYSYDMIENFYNDA